MNIVNNRVKFVSSLIIIFIIGIILAIVLPLTLIKDGDGLIIAIIPELSNDTIEFFKKMEYPRYKILLESQNELLINDIQENLGHFINLSIEGNNINILEKFVNRNGKITFFTENSFDGEISKLFFGKDERLLNIIPSAFISGEIESYVRINEDYLIYNQSYPNIYNSLKMMKKVNQFPFAITDSFSLKSYKIDNAEKSYVSALNSFHKKNINMFKDRRLMIFDFYKSFEALYSNDVAAYLYEMKHIFELFFQNRKVLENNILFLTIPTNKKVVIDKSFDLSKLEKIPASFEKIKENLGSEVECELLANFIQVDKIKNCDRFFKIDNEALHILINEIFNVSIKSEVTKYSQLITIGKKLNKLETKKYTFALLGHDIGKLFKFI